MSKEFICVVCPRGCHLHVSDDLVVTGNTCPRGEKYGKQEATNPTRVVTSTAVIDGSYMARCPVKTSDAVPKGKIFSVMKEIDALRLVAPIHMGQVLIKDVCGTGIDVVSTREMEKI